MGARRVLAGLVILLIGFVFERVTVRIGLFVFQPLRYLGILFYMIGGIVVVFGVIKSDVVRLALSLLVILGVLFFFVFGWSIGFQVKF